jgi:glutathione S-transferase
MLTVHHLGKSQSERIVWLCEELGIAYELKRYDRDTETMLAPPEYKALHPVGAAPVITDGPVVLAESVAIVEYILALHGGAQLAPAPDDPRFADYLYWFHFTNGTLQPSLGRNLVLKWIGIDDSNPAGEMMAERAERELRLVDARLREFPYLAGDTFTAADIMIVFSLTTMRHFLPYPIAPYPNIMAYLARIAERPAYRAAMAKGDPGMELLLT